MGKGIVTILLLLFSFLLPEEGNARLSVGKDRQCPIIAKAKKEWLSVSTGFLPDGIDQKISRIASASRCGHVLKDLGSSSSEEQPLTAICYYFLLHSYKQLQLVKSNYLLHIYPSHNFW